EALCTAYYHTFGTDVRVIRNFNTFGPRQKSSGYGAVISIFARRALDNRPILIYGDGSQTRDYQYIDDAVSGYLISQTIPAGTIMNTGFGEDFTINEIAEKIIEISKSSSNIVHTDARPGEVLKLRADITKAKSLGYTPQFSLEAGLKDFIAWMSKYDMESMGYMT
ncbi:MAG TPA: NAD-dependent epimerase/dehydratase family protein, partial [Nitrospinaceae bacterium]|nr:NAD-dependent epimerase/dehydratase family protein [Nitrospinaceae bacterium]